MTNEITWQIKWQTQNENKNTWADILCWLLFQSFSIFLSDKNHSFRFASTFQSIELSERVVNAFFNWFWTPIFVECIHISDPREKALFWFHIWFVCVHVRFAWQCNSSVSSAFIISELFSRRFSTILLNSLQRSRKKNVGFLDETIYSIFEWHLVIVSTFHFSAMNYVWHRFRSVTSDNVVSMNRPK